MANEFKIKHGFISTGDGSITGGLTVTGAAYADNNSRVATRPWITQFLTDNNYATSGDISTAISNLVDSAPGTLDTLNELAAALGDDPNFATTISTNIGTKVSKSGDTMTGNLRWTSSELGLEWSMNTDGAYIRFYNTGDADTNSRLEYGTTDNGNEYHRFMVAGIERMAITAGGISATGYNKSEWDTAYGWGNHASVGYATQAYASNAAIFYAGVVDTRINDEVLPAIPTNNNQLTNGAGYITDGNTNWNNIYGFITASSSITGTSAGVVRTVSGTSSAELVRGNMGDNDQARILVGASASNSGYLEIATADDGTEPIYVRQYTGVFSTLTRTATILDPFGNTSFPGTVSASSHGNSANWKQAYDNYITGAAFSGTTTKTLTLTQRDGGTITATFADIDTNTWRPIDDTPVNGVTDQSISSNWAYDHVNASNPHGTTAADVGADAAGSAAAVDARINDEVLPAIGDISLASLGFTGATNANYITNNNQLTNGAGYITDLPDGGVGAGTYGSTSNQVKIDTITVDAKGRVTAVATGTGGDITTVRLVDDSGSYVQDTGGTAVLTIAGGEGISTSASGTTITITNDWGNHASVGYLTSIPSSYATDAEVSSAVAAIEASINERIDTEVFDAIATVDGNIPTNNNQLTNGAGYITDGNTNWNNTYGFIASGDTQEPGGWTSATKFKSSGPIADADSGSHSLQVISDNNNDAFMAFHVSGDYAVFFGLDGGTNRLHTGGWSAGANQYMLWDSRDFTSTNISNWNTAYGWGNHADAGYLTSYTEADTLDSVTGRGNTTTNTITTGSITATSSSYVHMRVDQTDSALIDMGVSSGGAEGFLNVQNTGSNHSTDDPELKLLLNGTEYARLNATGLGIGTTSPSYKLDVNGDINIPNNSALFVDGALALTQDSASGFTSIGLGGALSVNPIQFTMTFNGADVLFGSLSSGAIPAKATFGVGDSGIVSDFPPSEVLRISSSSNVGIGVTNPSEKLEVNGNILAPSNSSAQLGRVYARNGIATDTNSQENLLNNTTRINGVLKDQFGNTGGSAGAYNLTTRTLAASNSKPYWYESYKHGSWSSINYKTNGSTFTPSFKKGYYTVNDYNVRVHGVFQVNSPMLIRNFVNDTNGTAAITSLPFAPANGLVNSSFSGYYDWNWGNILNAVEGGPLGTWVQLDAGRNFVRSGVMVGVTLDFSGTDLIVVAFMGGDNAPEYEIPVNHYIKFNFEYLKA